MSFYLLHKTLSHAYYSVHIQKWLLLLFSGYVRELEASKNPESKEMKVLM